MPCHWAAIQALQAILVIFLIPQAHGMGNTSTESKLLRDLFNNYNVVVRPVLDPGQSVLVKVSYFIRSLGVVDEKAQTVSLHGFLQLSWADEFLKWNPKDYGNIESIFVPVDRVWTPDIIMENGVGDQFFKKEHYCPRIHSDGLVRWEVGGEIELICDFSMHDYPFDEQACKMEVVTWAGTDDHIKIYGDFFDTKTYYVEQSNWQLTDTRAVNFSFIESGESYSEVHFHFGLKRKALAHILGVIIPVMLLSILNGVVFLLPAHSGEKISMSLTLLLSFTVLQLTIDSSIPSQSDSTPLLDIYITMFVVCSCLTIVVAVFAIRLHHRHDPITDNAKKFLRVYNSMAESLVSITDKKGANKGRSSMDSKKENELTWANLSYAFDRVWCVIFFLFFFVATSVILVKLIKF